MSRGHFILKKTTIHNGNFLKISEKQGDITVEAMMMVGLG